MAYSHPLAFLLGLEGIALLRALVDRGFDEAFVRARFDEIEAMLGAADGPRSASGAPIGEATTRDCYDEWATDYDNPGNPLIDVEEPIVRDILARLPAGHALDVACGTGRYAEFLAKQGHDVAGVDSSPPMLARARVKLPGVPFVEGEVVDLPFEAESFDLVVCGLAVVHQPNLDAVLAEFARVVRPGGHVVISDIHWMSLYLGGLITVTTAAGERAAIPTSRFRPADYVMAGLRAGLRIRDCREPSWGPLEGHGGPTAQQWCSTAAATAYEDSPAAIVVHFQREA